MYQMTQHSFRGWVNRAAITGCDLGACSRAIGAQAPVDDFGLVENEAIKNVVVVRRCQARCLADGAVDVADDPAGPADDVVVVVADPRLVARDHAQRLDAPDQADRVSALSTSYTACRDTSGRPTRTAEKIVSVSACGLASTTSSTATLGRVTRRSAIRNLSA